MPRRFLALDWREYAGTPEGRARFFGAVPVWDVGEGLKREKYLWGVANVLSFRGRKGFFAFRYYTPAPEAARNALLRYALYRVLEDRGYRLKGRLGEVLVFAAPDGGVVFVGAKWGGYAPSGVRRLWDSVERYVYQRGGEFWFWPAEGRRFGRFLRDRPVARVIPPEVTEEALRTFGAYARGSAPTPAVQPGSPPSTAGPS